jgi:hypothetical protein
MDEGGVVKEAWRYNKKQDGGRIMIEVRDG